MASYPPRRGEHRGKTDVRHRSSNVATCVVAALGIVLLLTGGSNQADVVQLLALRPAMVLGLALLLVVPSDRSVLRSLSFPLWLLGAFAALMALQLIPLPPSLWAAAPGHQRYLPAFALAQAMGTWHPLSLTPDRTWNSLLTLLVPLTTLIGYAALSPLARSRTLPVLIGAGLASAVLGTAQMVAGSTSWLYFYEPSDVGLPIGFLANRNHEGVLLATLLPALRAWTLANVANPQVRAKRTMIAVAAAFFIIPMILVTQSRAGFGLMFAGMLAAYLIEPRGRGRNSRRSGLLLGGAFAVVIAFVAVTVWSGRSTAFGRLVAGGGGGEIGRLAYVPTTLKMIRTSFPFGYGFGSFDPVFRGFEPDAMLQPTFVNHAHDDLLELIVTGGLPALAILMAFLAWWGYRTIRVFKRRDPTGPDYTARAAGSMILMLLLASLIDYPLRTPIMGAVFALLTAWLAEPNLEPWRLSPLSKASPEMKDNA